MPSKSVCSVCGSDDFVLTNAPTGTLVICRKCMELGVQAEQETARAKVKPSVSVPGSFRGKPAVCTLLLYTYFNVYTKSTMH